MCLETIMKAILFLMPSWRTIPMQSRNYLFARMMLEKLVLVLASTCRIKRFLRPRMFRPRTPHPTGIGVDSTTNLMKDLLTMIVVGGCFLIKRAPLHLLVDRTHMKNAPLFPLERSPNKNSLDFNHRDRIHLFYKNSLYHPP